MIPRLQSTLSAVMAEKHAFIAASDGLSPGKALTLKWETRNYFSESVLYIEWAHSFVTAVILDKDLQDLAPIKDDPSFDLWLRNWCSSHPTNYFVDALVAFLKDKAIGK